MVLSLLKKKKPEIISGKGMVPINRVKELSSKGFTEPEIIDMLRKEGYSPEEIDKALTEALKESMEKREEAESLPTIETLTSQVKEESAEKFEVPEAPVPTEYYENVPTEEYVEAYINARISEVEDKIKQIEARYNDIVRRFQEISGVVSQMSSRSKEDVDKIVNNIEELKENVKELAVKVSAFEKAFKETLPALIESVRALSNIVHELKK